MSGFLKARHLWETFSYDSENYCTETTFYALFNGAIKIFMECE